MQIRLQREVDGDCTNAGGIVAPEDIDLTGKLVVNEELPSSFKVLIDRNLKKFDEVVLKVEEWKKEMMPLKINGVGDVTGYEKVRKYLRFIVGRRTAIEDKRKEIKKEPWEYCVAIDDKAKEYSALIAPIEEHLEAEKKRIDEEKKEIEIQDEIKKQEKIKLRHSRLVEIGMQPVGKLYIYKTEEYLASKIETATDNNFEEYIAAVTELINTDKKKEADELLKKQQEDADLLKQKQKLQAEQDKMIQERLDMRLEILSPLGAVIGSDKLLWTSNHTGNVKGITIPVSSIKDYTSTEFNEQVASIKKRQAEWKKKDIADNRAKELVNLGYKEHNGTYSLKNNTIYFTQLEEMTEPEWLEKICLIQKNIAEDKARLLKLLEAIKDMGIDDSAGNKNSSFKNILTYKGQPVLHNDEIIEAVDGEWNGFLSNIRKKIEDIDNVEKEKEKNLLVQNRELAITKLGFRKINKGEKATYELGSLISNYSELRDLNEDKWNEKITFFEQQVTAIFNQRIAELKAIGAEYSDLTGFIFYKQNGLNHSVEVMQVTDDKWSDFVSGVIEKTKAINKAIADRIAKEKLDAENAEKEKVANMTDSNKFSHYITLLLAVPVPEMKTAKWTTTINNLIKFIKNQNK